MCLEIKMFLVCHINVKRLKEIIFEIPCYVLIKCISLVYRCRGVSPKDLIMTLVAKSAKFILYFNILA